MECKLWLSGSKQCAGPCVVTTVDERILIIVIIIIIIIIPLVISSTGVIPKSLPQSLKRLNLHPNT